MFMMDDMLLWDRCWNLWQLQWNCAQSASSYCINWRIEPLLLTDNHLIKPYDVDRRAPIFEKEKE